MRIQIVLIGVVLFSLAAASIDKVKEARKVIGKVGFVLDLYYVDCHEYPPSLNELVHKPESCKAWGPDPYLTHVLKDPWGNDFVYSRPDPKHYMLKSLGADGKEGGEMDKMDIAITR